MANILADVNIFKKLNRDPTLTIQTRSNNCIIELEPIKQGRG